MLTLYGLRKSDDIDILCAKSLEYDNEINNNGIDLHDSELKFHGVPKNTLIFDPNYYFTYCGIKFVSFQQLYIMKSSRGEDKDEIDCGIMHSLLNGNSVRKKLLILQQNVSYLWIKSRSKFRNELVRILKKTNLYSTVKFIYNYLASFKL